MLSFVRIIRNTNTLQYNVMESMTYCRQLPSARSSR